MITGLVGDALQPRTEPPLIIAHVLSTRAAYGVGFAAQVARRWPQLPFAYRDWVLPAHPGFSSTKLGAVQFVEVAPGLTIAHLCAMRGLRSRHNPVPLVARSDRIGSTQPSSTTPPSPCACSPSTAAPPRPASPFTCP